MPSIRLADLAQQLDAELHGDGDIVITGVASMQSALHGRNAGDDDIAITV